MEEYSRAEDEEAPLGRAILIRHHTGLRFALVNRDLNDGDYDTLLLLDEPVQQQLQARLAARPEQIASLPTFAITERSEQLENTCPICLESLSVADVMRTMPCMHVFHKTCVDTWLAIQGTCPICKFQI